MILLLLAQIAYVGNGACSGCHAALYRSYSQTPMARSSGEVGASIVEGAFRHASSSVNYRLYRANGRSFLEYQRPGDRSIRGGQELHYFIGSEAAGRSYLFSIDRFLYQAPVTYYSQTRRWDMSPGYESDPEVRLNRPIEPNCLFCHASQVQMIYGTQNRYAERPFLQDGIGCERCHGPGSLHVAGKGRMVNPAKLTPERRDSVCAQCHLTGEARIERPEKKLSLYRPSDLLSDFVSYFVFDGAVEKGLKATSHFEKLSQSLCKARSGDRLWCGACHDPHSVPEAAQRAGYFRRKCLTCHQTQQCARGGDCAACHMPKARVVDGGHGVLTDHGIPRKPLPAKPNPAVTLKLARFGAAETGPRALGLAYAEVALRTGEKFHPSEAIRLLEQALPDHSDDPEVLTRLAYLYQQGERLDQAASWYEASLKLNPAQVVAAVNLGGICAKRGQIDRAIALWQDALDRNPGLSEAGLNLALALRAKGEPLRAREALQRVLRFDPDSRQARQLLADLGREP